MKDKSSNPKILLRTIMGVIIVILLIYISGFSFKRFDLTEEKRHSLMPTTKEILEDLGDDPIFFKVYLKGDYPKEYKRLEKGIREKLDEMKAYAGDRLEYEFINPSISDDKEDKLKTYQQLADAGLKYTSIQVQTNDGMAEKIIFPGAIVTYKNEAKSLQILKSRTMVPDLEMINNSINNLEYEFARIINEILSTKRPTIAFTHGHGESSARKTQDAEMALAENYNVQRIEFDGNLNGLSKMLSDTVRYRQNLYDMLIISDPDSAFTDQEKFLLDQYMVRGGKVLLFMDPMDVNLDSLRRNQETMAVSRDLNISDMIYDHGIRFDKNILIDKNCAIIKLETGQTGNQKQYGYFPWYYKPVLIPGSGHPVVSNIDPLVTEFVSSISVIDKPHLEETVLLQSSESCLALRQPVRINAGIVGVELDFSQNNSPNLPIGALVEGKFKSAYIDRLPPAFANNTQVTFVEQSIEPSALLVVADGNFIVNRVSTTGQVFELGYDRNAQRKIYGNKDFLLNAVNYMLNDERLINLRSRTITLRPLDAQIVDENSSLIKVGNMVLPSLLVVLIGLILAFVRRKKFATNNA